MPEACLVCREHSGDVPVPGGLLVADDLVIAFHLPPVDVEGSQRPDVYLGYLMVTPRRHAPGFADLDESEAAAMGVAIARLSRALRALGADRVYLAGSGTAFRTCTFTWFRAGRRRHQMSGGRTWTPGPAPGEARSTKPRR